MMQTNEHHQKCVRALRFAATSAMDRVLPLPGVWASCKRRAYATIGWHQTEHWIIRSSSHFFRPIERKGLPWSSDGPHWGVLSGMESQRARSSHASPQDSWRYLKIALKCPAECSFRTVPKSMSCLTRAHALLMNPTAGERHPPSCHVPHGRHPHQSGEALSKDRSGQLNLPGEGSHGPGFLGATMDQHERTPDVRISECPKPARPSILVALQPCPDGLHHHTGLDPVYDRYDLEYADPRISLVCPGRSKGVSRLSSAAQPRSAHPMLLVLCFRFIRQKVGRSLPEMIGRVHR